MKEDGSGVTCRESGQNHEGVARPCSPRLAEPVPGTVNCFRPSFRGTWGQRCSLNRSFSGPSEGLQPQTRRGLGRKPEQSPAECLGL